MTACDALNRCLDSLAADYPSVKFCRIRASEARLSINFVCVPFNILVSKINFWIWISNHEKHRFLYVQDIRGKPQYGNCRLNGATECHYLTWCNCSDILSTVIAVFLWCTVHIEICAFHDYSPRNLSCSQEHLQNTWQSEWAFIVTCMYMNVTLPSVLQQCWFGDRKGIWPVQVLLRMDNLCQITIWPSWPGKCPLNVCICIVSLCLGEGKLWFQTGADGARLASLGKSI